MDAFRPPFPGNVHGALCPVCLAPHFPFCPPIRFDHHPPPYHGAFPPNHPFRGHHVANPPPNLSNFPHGPNPPFMDRDPQFQSAESLFANSSIRPHFPGRHPQFLHMGSQHPFPLEHRVSPHTRDLAGHRVPHDWIDMQKERENQWLLQQQRKAVGTMDRFIPLGVESGSTFVQENKADKVLMPDENDTSLRFDSSEHKTDFGFQGDVHNREGDNMDTESLSETGKQVPNKFSKTGDVPDRGGLQGNSWKNKGSTIDDKKSFEVVEPNNNARRDIKLWDSRIEAHPQQGNTIEPDAYSERSYFHGGAGPLQSGIPKVERSLEKNRVIYSGPGQVQGAKSFEDKPVSNKKRKGLISREEELLIEHGWQTLESKLPTPREEVLVHERGLHSDRVAAAGLENNLLIEPDVQKKSLKRKQPMTQNSWPTKHGLENKSFQQQPMSREEELLMEQGLLDDDPVSSRTPVQQAFADAARHVDGQRPLNKQGLPGEEQMISFTPGYQHFFYQGKVEGDRISSHQPAKSIEHGDKPQFIHPVQKLQPFRMENEGAKKWESIAERSLAGRFSKSIEERVSCWPVEGFGKADEFQDRTVLHDVSMDRGGKAPLGESPYARGWHLSDSGHSIEGRPLLQAGIEQCDSEEAQRRKEILQRQYQEWEAEQQHMEALKRAEELAREIQQREENTQQMGFAHSIPRQDAHAQQQLSLEKRGQFHHSQVSPGLLVCTQVHPSSQVQPASNMLHQNPVIQSPTFQAHLFPDKVDFVQHQSSVHHSSNFSPHLNTHTQGQAEGQLQKQVPMIQLSHSQQEVSRRKDFQEERQHESVVQGMLPFPPQSFHPQQHLNTDTVLATESHDHSLHKRPYEQWQPQQHQVDTDLNDPHVKWSAPHLQPAMLQLKPPHLSTQSSHANSHSYQARSQQQQQEQLQHGQPYQHQQPLSIQPMQSHHSNSVVHDGSQAILNRGGLSLSQPYEKHSSVTNSIPAIPSQPNQYQLGVGPELHRRSFHPPLPSTASVDPPPPNSPPPLPSSGPIPPPDPPPPPPSFSSSLPPAGLGSTPLLVQHSFDGQGHSQSFQLQQAQNQPVPIQNSGPRDLHRLQQTGMHLASQLPIGQFGNQHSHFPLNAPQQPEKSKVVDAVNVFRNPGRRTRPDRFVVILRGFPGSGKSYIAKTLRDVEVMNGGSAPRIHSMDDYFMSEVEKVEDDETGTSSLRSKNKVVKRVMEYCYEPEMEEAYRASMLKAFRKTLEEGMFNFVIVDDRNVLVADFAQFWAIAKRSGYEVYVVEAPYSDVTGCAARNVHNFTLEQIQSMADHWEPTPLLYLRMDISSLFRGDDLSAQDIIEVEMDADDMERDVEEEEEDPQSFEFDERQSASSYHLNKEKAILGERWEDRNAPVEKVRSSSKSMKRLEDDNSEMDATSRDTSNALSGLMKMYAKKDKFVHWSDNQGVKGSNKGFSIGATPQKNAHLIIGPGPGYNQKSNPIMEERPENPSNTEVRRSTKFREQLRAEQEAFKAVFARRRHRIGGMEDDDED